MLEITSNLSRETRTSPSVRIGQVCQSREKCDLPTPPVGGRLAHFLATWTHTTSDEWSLEIVSQGYSIEFQTLPPDRFLRSPSGKWPQKHLILQQAIPHLLHIDAIEPIPKDQEGAGVYSIFTVPKRNSDWRLILDLKYVNRYICQRHFHMELLKSITATLQLEEFMTSLDLTEAYLHVPILPNHRKFLHFCQRGTPAVQSPPLWSVHCSQGLHEIPGELSRIPETEGDTCTPLSGQPADPHQFIPESAAIHTGGHGLPSISWFFDQLREKRAPSIAADTAPRHDTGHAVYESIPNSGHKTVDMTRSLLRRPENNLRSLTQLLGLMMANMEPLQWGRLHTRVLQWFLAPYQHQIAVKIDQKLRVPSRVRRSLCW